MSKMFNISGDCKPEIHYMVDISEKLKHMKAMVDQGQYFTINRARQYGKTTTLNALEKYLRNEYEVVSLDFQMLGYASFETEQMFVEALANELLDSTDQISDEIKAELKIFAEGDMKSKGTLQKLFRTLSKWCRNSLKPIVLMIDEVDSAANNQVFLDFLAQLRGYYIKRTKFSTFQSVILAGVYDIKNIKRKLRPDEDHKINSPWNTREGNEPCESLLSYGDCPRDQMVLVPFDIAVPFKINMSFSKAGIAGMLSEYEKDHQTGMDVSEIAGLLYDYTSGYPFLVSQLCKLMDETVAGTGAFPDKAAAWTKQGFLEAVQLLLSENNTLFESLMGKLIDYPELRQRVYSLLFAGEVVAYNVLDQSMMRLCLASSRSRIVIL